MVTLFFFIVYTRNRSRRPTRYSSYRPHHYLTNTASAQHTSASPPPPSAPTSLPQSASPPQSALPPQRSSPTPTQDITSTPTPTNIVTTEPRVHINHAKSIISGEHVKRISGTIFSIDFFCFFFVLGIY
jgi:hypothetical protein